MTTDGYIDSPSIVLRLHGPHLRRLTLILAFLDDLLVFSTTDEDHHAHLRILIERMLNFG